MVKEITTENCSAKHLLMATNLHYHFIQKQTAENKKNTRISHIIAIIKEIDLGMMASKFNSFQQGITK